MNSYILNSPLSSVKSIRLSPTLAAKWEEAVPCKSGDWGKFIGKRNTIQTSRDFAVISAFGSVISREQGVAARCTTQLDGNLWEILWLAMIAEKYAGKFPGLSYGMNWGNSQV